MKVTAYANAQAFLGNTQADLESNEAVNCLMLGIYLRQVRYPERVGATPCLKTVHDENGLVLAATMDLPHNLVVYWHQGDLDVAARAVAGELVREGWPIPGVLGPDEAARAMAEHLGKASSRPHRMRQRQQLCELREVQTPAPQQGRLRLATPDDKDPLARWWYEFSQDVSQEITMDEARGTAEWRIGVGDVYLWDVGQPVSMAGKTRPTRRGISVGPVYTPPEWRRHGYAGACVAELSRLLLAGSREFCTLFVAEENVIARRVYDRIGYRPLCDYEEWVFE